MGTHRAHASLYVVLKISKIQNDFAKYVPKIDFFKIKCLKCSLKKIVPFSNFEKGSVY